MGRERREVDYQTIPEREGGAKGKKGERDAVADHVGASSEEKKRFGKNQVTRSGERVKERKVKSRIGTHAI